MDMTAVERELQRQQDQIKRFGSWEDSLTAMADARDILYAAIEDDSESWAFDTLLSTVRQVNAQMRALGY